jgi:glyoxylase-like metal-dependent hydrolase (beta-lactamase superfamily II)
VILRCFEGGPFQENAYVVACSRTGRAAVVDPGGGTPALLRAVEEEGWTLESILLTHAHLDHVDGIPLVRGHAPDVPVYLHPLDRPVYEAVPQQASLFGLPVPVLPPQTLDLVPGSVVEVGEVKLEVRFAPGHAPGHVILVSESEDVALVGDVIFRGSIGRTDLPGGDTATLMDSIRDRILTLPDHARLFPGHGPDTTVSLERRSNPFVLQMLQG